MPTEEITGVEELITLLNPDSQKLPSRSNMSHPEILQPEKS